MLTQMVKKALKGQPDSATEKLWHWPADQLTQPIQTVYVQSLHTFSACTELSSLSLNNNVSYHPPLNHGAFTMIPFVIIIMNNNNNNTAVCSPILMVPQVKEFFKPAEHLQASSL